MYEPVKCENDSSSVFLRKHLKRFLQCSRKVFEIGLNGQIELGIVYWHLTIETYFDPCSIRKDP